MSGSKSNIVTELEKIDKAMDSGVVDDVTVLRRIDLKNNLLKVTEMEAKDRIQKSKVKWAVEGDENSRKLLKNQADNLERGVSRDEIRRAVWNCGDNKSPGPDGLVSVIGDLVSDTQSAFVAGRQILDGPFILDEILNWCKRKKNQAMFFKVDFAKAYDSVRWDYLLDVLEAFGFGHVWCSWIRGTLCSSKASILVNGSPFQEFSCYRGLKQGDPLAPYLFILIMESLHLSFSRVVDEGLFKGIQLSGSISLSHLFYADDAMFIWEWSDGT
nr:RNA-directed DNA polymerase, eukaryota [Tanacetum cinerariifolium]